MYYFPFLFATYIINSIYLQLMSQLQFEVRHESTSLVFVV